MSCTPYPSIPFLETNLSHPSSLHDLHAHNFPLFITKAGRTLRYEMHCIALTDEVSSFYSFFFCLSFDSLHVNICVKSCLQYGTGTVGMLLSIYGSTSVGVQCTEAESNSSIISLSTLICVCVEYRITLFVCIYTLGIVIVKAVSSVKRTVYTYSHRVNRRPQKMSRHLVAAIGTRYR